MESEASYAALHLFRESDTRLIFKYLAGHTCRPLEKKIHTCRLADHERNTELASCIDLAALQRLVYGRV